MSERTRSPKGIAAVLSRGFSGFRRPQPPREIPSGQYYETGFPVLTYGPTERVSQQDWKFTIELGDGAMKSWNWDDLMAICAIMRFLSDRRPR